MEYFLADGVKLPPKTSVQIQTYALHRDAKAFKDPERFDPNRFLKNSLAEYDSDSEIVDFNGDRNPFAYIPFGNSDLCIGMIY